MGNRSSINYYSWSNIGKFLYNIAPYYDTTYDTENMLNAMPNGYKELNKEQKITSALLSVGGRPSFSMAQMFITEDGLLIDLEDWKIQGYWYEDFCNMLILFHDMGLRGHIHMTEETDQDFDIRLNDDGVEVEIWEPGEEEYDEETDTHTRVSYSEDMESEIHIIKDGGLR